MSLSEQLTKLYARALVLLEDGGQDLIEYVLVIALIAFAASAGMQTVATDINTAFSNIGTKVSTYTS